jgi:hypothetical protein
MITQKLPEPRPADNADFQLIHGDKRYASGPKSGSGQKGVISRSGRFTGH